MARPGFFKRIVKEVFDDEDQDLVEKLSFPINYALDYIDRSYNRGLTLQENFNASVKDVDVIVNSSGTPTPAVAIKSDLLSPCKAIWVGRAENISSPTTYPTGAPFVSFTDDGGKVSIKNITGLQANTRYRLRLYLFG